MKTIVIWLGLIGDVIMGQLHRHLHLLSLGLWLLSGIRLFAAFQARIASSSKLRMAEASSHRLSRLYQINQADPRGANVLTH